MSVTLKDIATSLGLSINTVSRALRQDKNISAETRERCALAAKEMNYIPNAIASSMRTQHSMTIGVISADSANPFFNEVIKGISDKAGKLGYHILLGSTEESLKKETEMINMFLSRRVDGLIVMPVFDNCKEHLALYENLRVPFIFPGRYLEGLENHSVLHEDVEALVQVFEYLFNNGHTKILYIAGPNNVSNTYDRIKGMRLAYEKNGIEFNEDYLICAEGHIEDGYAIVNQALSKGLDFTAIVCFNDMIAMGVLKSLSENDLKVPRDIEVFGFDNLYMSQFMQPALSTVNVPKFNLGYQAMESLDLHIKDKELPYQTIKLPTRILFRETTR